jgi:hypothetical protein
MTLTDDLRFGGHILGHVVPIDRPVGAEIDNKIYAI